MALKSKLFPCVLLLVSFNTSVLGGGWLCGPTQEVKLHSSGRASAVSLTLSNGNGNSTEPCTLNIFAPNVYALALRIIDAHNPFELENDEPSSKWRLRRKSEKLSNGPGKNKTMPDCTLQAFYLDAKHGSIGAPALKVSPCAPEMARGPLELLPQPIRIQWWPPKLPKKTDNLRLIVTAVNAGAECLRVDQVVCLRAGEDPLLCVSEALACDGVRHCPQGDEDEGMRECERRKATWAEDLVRRIASRHQEFLGLDTMQFIPTEDVAMNVSVTPKREKKITALEAALAPYGPWGYLLLGTLICAMMMVFFTIWECCCHRNKIPQAPIPPDCEAPAAVGLGPSPPRPHRHLPPPTYEELEQPPPPYSTLFPRAKITPITEIDNQEATTSSGGIL